MGSTFCLTACPDQAKVTDSTSPVVDAEGSGVVVDAALRTRHAGRRILLVEDDPTNQEVARAFARNGRPDRRSGRGWRSGGGDGQQQTVTT